MQRGQQDALLAQRLHEQRGAGADIFILQRPGRVKVRPRRVVVDGLNLDVVFHTLKGYQRLRIHQDGSLNRAGRQMTRVRKGQTGAIQIQKVQHIAVEAARQYRHSLFVQQTCAQQRSQSIEIALLVCQNDLHDLIVHDWKIILTLRQGQFMCAARYQAYRAVHLCHQAKQC